MLPEDLEVLAKSYKTKFSISQKVLGVLSGKVYLCECLRRQFKIELQRLRLPESFFLQTKRNYRCPAIYEGNSVYRVTEGPCIGAVVYHRPSRLSGGESDIYNISFTVIKSVVIRGESRNLAGAFSRVKVIP